jgi:hypothetical protein
MSTHIAALPTGFQIEIALRVAVAALSVVDAGPAVTATAVGAPQVMPPPSGATPLLVEVTGNGLSAETGILAPVVAA